MAQQRSDKKPGLVDQLLGAFGFKKPVPPAPAPRHTGSMMRKLGTGEQFVRSKDPGEQPAFASRSITEPLSPEERAQRSEERRYLIAAYEATPTLIPEFQNPTYMYKMISNERDYTQELLNDLLAERKGLLMEAGPEITEELEERLNEMDLQAQELRNDLTRLFLLIKKVAGIQKNGTGGTDFLDPLRQ